MEGDGSPRFTRRAMESARGGPPAGGVRETVGGRGNSQRVDMFGREPTPPRSTRRVVEELSIPEGAVHEEAPERFRRKKSRAVPIFMTLLLLGGGGYGAARYLGLFGTETAPVPGAATETSGAPPAVAEPAGAKPTGEPRPAAAPKTGDEPKTAGEPKVEGEPKAAAEPPSAAAPATPEPAGATPGSEGAGSGAAAPGKSPAAAEKTPAAAANEKPAPRHTAKAPRGRDVFKESAKRVRSLSQGLDQFPPGTIQLAPPAADIPQ